MKKVFTMVALAMAALNVSAETEINASTVELNNNACTELADMSQKYEEIKEIDIYSNADKKDRNHNFSVVCAPQLYVGVNLVSGAPQDVSFNAFNTHDIWLNNIIALKFSPLNSKVGFTFGYGWKGDLYKMTGENCFDLNNDKVVEVTKYPQGYIKDFSRVKTFSHTFSLLANWEVANKTNLRFGPTMSLVSGKSILTKFEDANETVYSEKSGAIKVNTVNFDVMASLTYYNIGFYVKYAPQSVFKGDYGPQFSTMTVGLTAGF